MEKESDGKKTDAFFKKFQIQERYRPETTYIVYFQVEKPSLVEFKGASQVISSISLSLVSSRFEETG
ncbi:MAG: hypothetical protein WBI10_03650 [Syntrophales bacterium]